MLPGVHPGERNPRTAGGCCYMLPWDLLCCLAFPLLLDAGLAELRADRGPHRSAGGSLW